MKKYTVILLYPDYVAENYGQETYMTSVEAEDPVAAVAKARSEVLDAALTEADGGQYESEYEDPADLFVIAVIEGEHADVNPE